MSEPVRIIYHPAPGPDRAGNIVVPSPVRLGSDVALAMRWVRRRLGLRPYGALIEACRFTDEVLPLGDPSDVRVTAAASRKKSGRNKKGRAKPSAPVMAAETVEALSISEDDIAQAMSHPTPVFEPELAAPGDDTPIRVQPVPLSAFEDAPDLPSDFSLDLEGGSFEAPVLD